MPVGIVTINTIGIAIFSVSILGAKSTNIAPLGIALITSHVTTSIIFAATMLAFWATLFLTFINCFFPLLFEITELITLEVRFKLISDDLMLSVLICVVFVNLTIYDFAADQTAHWFARWFQAMEENSLVVLVTNLEEWAVWTPQWLFIGLKFIHCCGNSIQLKLFHAQLSLKCSWNYFTLALRAFNWEITIGIFQPTQYEILRTIIFTDMMVVWTLDP